LERKKLLIGITIPGSVPLIRGQAKYFVDRGYDVYLMCPKSEKSIDFCEEEGCTLLDVNIERYIRPLKDLKSLFEIYRKIRNLKPNIVNVGTPKMGLIGSLAAWMARVDYRIYTCRGLRYEHEIGFSKLLLKSLEKACGAVSHKVICISPSVRDRAVQDKVFKENRIEVISQGSSNGINLEKFNRDAVRMIERQQMKIDLDLEGKFVFGFVGRLIDRKGINELIEAFEYISEKYSDSVLILVGKKDLSQLRDPGIIKRIEKNPSIKWVGWQDNIPLYMSMFDVFVMPAWWEGFGNTYVEAANMKVAVIGSDGTGCQDAVKHDFNGIIVQRKNVEEVKEAMMTYLEDKALLKKHGENGPIWSQNFQQVIIWQGLDNIYKNQ
jgi:glycosyltransferase involved in cell wall biosynthesis